MGGVNPISFQDILAYAKVVGFKEADETLFFGDVMAACDALFLKKTRETMRQEQEAARAAAKARRRA